MYKNDVRNGMAKRTLTDLTIWVGIYEGGNPIGEGIYYFTNKTTLKAPFFLALSEPNEIKIYLELKNVKYENLAKKLMNQYISGKDIYHITTTRIKDLDLTLEEEEQLIIFKQSIHEQIFGYLHYPFMAIINHYMYDITKIYVEDNTERTLGDRITFNISPYNYSIHVYSEVMTTRCPVATLYLINQ